jgi:hypothetical protein
MTRKYPEHNRVGLFRKLRHEGWLVQHYAGGKPYMKGNIIVRSSVLEPVYSYGNNYSKFGKEFSLFMWTNESDIAKVGKHFDAVVKGLKRDDFNMDVADRFVYLNNNYKGDK